MFAFLKLNHAVKKNDFAVHDFVKNLTRHQKKKDKTI
jgi:hypothetical protein